jgi:glycine hydroxymethyltransferase
VIANAHALAETLVSHDFQIVSGGTDNHLMLVDLRNKKLTGKEAQEALEAAGITVNKNSVPFDDQSPLITSGFRIGTPALTTRGMKEPEMKQIGDWIHQVLSDIKNDAKKVEVRANINELCKKFPLYL